MNAVQKGQRRRKWCSVGIVTLIFVILLLLIGFLLIFNDFPMYNKRILMTKWEIKRARGSIEWFKEKRGELPENLNEINKMAENYSDLQYLREKPFVEYISSRKGNRNEYNTLNGDGGFCYNDETGEIKVNVTKPVSHYLWFYTGKERSEIPADW